MKLISAAAVAVIAVLMFGGQARSEPPMMAGAEYVFTGYSNLKRDGDDGYTGMNTACHEAFGDDARMATTAEFLTSPVAAAPAEDAWIRVTLFGHEVRDRETLFLIDVSGYTARVGSLTCSWWSEGGRHRFRPVRVGLLDPSIVMAAGMVNRS